jgi:hypothetical protein
MIFIRPWAQAELKSTGLVGHALALCSKTSRSRDGSLNTFLIFLRRLADPTGASRTAEKAFKVEELLEIINSAFSHGIHGVSASLLLKRPEFRTTFY